MKKRLLSILLICCMLFTLFPAAALAETQSAAGKGGDAAFTLRADSYACADGHPGELGLLQIRSVDVSQWEAKRQITVRYSVEYRCTEPACGLYNDAAFYSYDGEHTFTNVDAELCHKKFSGTFAAAISTEYRPEESKDYNVSFTLISDKGISAAVYHAPVVNACTESYYSVQCWECTGCGYYFMDADMSGTKLTRDQVFFPPAGHNTKHFDAKAPTCVAKGTVEYWQCGRCELKFSDAAGQNELTSIETDAPLAAHRYDGSGVCTVCSRKAAAGVKTAAAADTVWYDAMTEALAALTDGAQLTINADYADTLTLDKTCTVEVNAGAAVSEIRVEDVENCAVTLVNNGTVNVLTGYTGRLILRSGSGVYGSVANQSENGSAGSFLYQEDTAKFCCYKTPEGAWLRPDEASQSRILNVTVAYAPLASLSITGEDVTGGNGSYALSAQRGDTVALTAAAYDMDGGSAEAASYRWYYESDPDALLSTESTLTLENIRAGKRTVVCEAAADGYGVAARLVLTVSGQKDEQSLTLASSRSSVGVREKILPLLSVEGVQEEAPVTYYQMNGAVPDPENDTEIGADFAFTATGE